MDPAHVVLLIAIFIAVAAIAGYLIWIAMILKHVVNRLVTILGAVDATTDAAQPVGAVIDDINRDLDAGRRLLEDCVARLAEDREPVGATAEPRHGTAAESGRHATPDALSSAGGIGSGTATAARPPAPTGTEEDRLSPGTEDDQTDPQDRPDPRTEEDRPDPRTEEDRPDPRTEEDRPDPRTEEDRPGRPPQGRGRGWWNR
jgi:hypothetical protein